MIKVKSSQLYLGRVTLSATGSYQKGPCITKRTLSRSQRNIRLKPNKWNGNEDKILCYIYLHAYYYNSSFRCHLQGKFPPLSHKFRRLWNWDPLESSLHKHKSHCIKAPSCMWVLPLTTGTASKFNSKSVNDKAGHPWQKNNVQRVRRDVKQRHKIFSLFKQWNFPNLLRLTCAFKAKNETVASIIFDTGLPRLKCSLHSRKMSRDTKSLSLILNSPKIPEKE